MRTKIEGFRCWHLGWGTAVAVPISVAFVVSSINAGTTFVKLSNDDQSRCYYHEITLSGGGTWNFVAFTVPGDVTGAWQVVNNIGLTFELFAAGKETTPAAVLDAWTTTNKVATTNSTSLLSANNGDALSITGLWIAAGAQLPSAESEMSKLVRPIPDEIKLCQRYFWMTYNYGATFLTNTTAGAMCSICDSSGTRIPGPFSYPTEMRTTPTITLASAIGTTGVWEGVGGINTAAATAAHIGQHRFMYAQSSGLSAQAMYYGHVKADARL
jgi:hypothetical protein